MFTFAINPGLSAHTYTLAGGRDGILQTVGVMREMVDEYKKHPFIRATAVGELGFLPQKDHLAEVETLFYFVRDKIRYLQDVYGVETLATPVQVLHIGQGDCDDKATLLAALLESVGFQTAFKITGYHGPDFEHVYVYVIGPDFTIHLDPTEPEPAGYEPPNPTVTLYVG